MSARSLDFVKAVATTTECPWWHSGSQRCYYPNDECKCRIAADKVVNLREDEIRTEVMKIMHKEG